MRLESAVFSGASGINSHGSAIAVVGNNISNSNTTAFKESRAEFAELIGKSFEGGSTTADDYYAGSGTQIINVRELFSAGVLEGTGRTLDAGIDGEGFFMVGDPQSPLLTRAGNFSIDNAGNLTSASGLPVLGILEEGGALSPLNLYNLNLTAQATTQVTARGNLDATSPVTQLPNAPADFQAIGKLASFQQSMSVYDSLGASHDITVAFFKTAAGTFTAQAYIDGSETGGTAGTPVAVGNPVTLNFSETGQITNPEAAVISAAPAFAGGAAAGNFTIDLSGFTQYASPSSSSNVTKNGQGAGNIKNYEIRSDGGIYAQLDTGDYKLIGTLQLANYPNKDALERIGTNLYRPMENAGDIITGSPGDSSLGAVKGGMLERSTVDLATQFTNVILLQRGYQANAQMMNKATELLQQTLQLIR